MNVASLSRDLPKGLTILKEFPNWVGGNLPKKIPLNPHTNHNAQSNNPKTWGSYDQALKAQKTYGWDLIGFCCHPETIPLAFIDLDHCIVNGEIQNWATEIIKAINSYSEVSPSGEGIHILAYGYPPGNIPTLKVEDGDIALAGEPPKIPEIYHETRWFTVTGDHVPGTPETIEDRPREIAALYGETKKQFDGYKRRLTEAKRRKNQRPTRQKSQGQYNGNDSAYTDLKTEILAAYDYDTLLRFAQSLYPGTTESADHNGTRITGYGGLIVYPDPQPHWKNYSEGSAADPVGGDVFNLAALHLWGAHKVEGRDFHEAVIMAGAFVGIDVDARLKESRQAHKVNGSGSSNPHGSETMVSDDQANGGEPAPVIVDQDPPPDLAKSNGKPPKPTHDELADRWVEKANQTIYGLGDWRRYKNGVWEALPELVVKREIKKVSVAAKPEGIRPNSAMISSIADLAKFDLATDDTLFDADINYLVCANGTLHIPSRTLTAHDPNLYATSGVGYAYDPDAKAPHWQVFLMSIFTEDVAAFLQEFAGYCLTTDTSYEVAVWLYGLPGGGKSTFVLGITSMLGNRAGVLGLADIERSRFALSNLPGKTLVVATEQPSIYLSATHTLNAIISGEPIPIDRKFKDPYDLIPRAKILWSMNGLPRVNDPSNGLFRRVKVVSMPPLAEDEKDPRFKREIEKEGAGILNWALDGLARLRQRDGFNIPESVKSATENFKKNNDIPAAFVADRCVTGCNGEGIPWSEKSSVLYSAYRNWCIDTNHKPQSSTSIADDWKRLGFEQKRKTDGVYWLGVKLTSM